MLLTIHLDPGDEQLLITSLEAKMKDYKKSIDKKQAEYDEISCQRFEDEDEDDRTKMLTGIQCVINYMQRIYDRMKDIDSELIKFRDNIPEQMTLPETEEEE